MCTLHSSDPAPQAEENIKVVNHCHGMGPVIKSTLKEGAKLFKWYTRGGTAHRQHYVNINGSLNGKTQQIKITRENGQQAEPDLAALLTLAIMMAVASKEV